MFQEKEPSAPADAPTDANTEAAVDVLPEAYSFWKNPSLRAIVICACLSVVFLKSGFLSMIFLAPFGYAILAYNALFLTVTVTAVIHALVSVTFKLFFNGNFQFLGIELLYLLAQILGFAWIMAGARFSNIRSAYRFIISSAAASVFFIILFLITIKDPGFESFVNSLSLLFSSMVLSSSGADAVTQSYFQQMMSAESMQRIFHLVILRGGAIATVFMLFFLNRQLSGAMLWFFKRKKEGKALSEFFTPPNTIWALIFSLALILIARMFRIELIEALAWNVFIVCAILFLAQGAGIVMFILSRRQGLIRLAATVLIVIMILSPGFNVIALAALVLLGITETWASFRIAKPEITD
ncbi:MAG: YybS family protein [Treponema sp.]|jgi:hypothetical protein|nr:YybS family protein [Treponema sp.]